MTKPTFNVLWAKDGDIVAPTSEKIAQGWLSGEIPSSQNQNYLMQQVDTKVNYLNQAGIPEWDSVTIYFVGSIVQYEGYTYKCIQSNSNVPPTSSLSRWTRTAATYGNATVADVRAKVADDLVVTPDVLTDYVNSIIANILPVGVPLPSPYEVCPDGWLECNGQAFNKTENPFLAKAYPTGVLPDLRGEFLRGADSGRGVDPNRKILSVQSSENKAHTHTGEAVSKDLGTKTTTSDGNHTHKLPWQAKGSGGGGAGADYYGRWATDTREAGIHNHRVVLGSHNHSLDINSSGGSESRPRNVAFMYIVRKA